MYEPERLPELPIEDTFERKLDRGWEVFLAFAVALL
jgi:hypothetical protein